VKLYIEIYQDNAAFADGGVNEETARILSKLAREIADYRSGLNERLADGASYRKKHHKLSDSLRALLFDVNGNKTGEVHQKM